MYMKHLWNYTHCACCLCLGILLTVTCVFCLCFMIALFPCVDCFLARALDKYVCSNLSKLCQLSVSQVVFVTKICGTAICTEALPWTSESSLAYGIWFGSAPEIAKVSRSPWGAACKAVVGPEVRHGCCFCRLWFTCSWHVQWCSMWHLRCFNSNIIYCRILQMLTVFIYIDCVSLFVYRMFDTNNWRCLTCQCLVRPRRCGRVVGLHLGTFGSLVIDTLRF